MAVHSFINIQKIPITIGQAWDFYSNPANLRTITPPPMNFRIISHFHGEKLYPGQIIEYKVSPLLGIPLYWMSEVTHVAEPFYFADEQRRGPYSFWQHQHHFKAIDGGMEMKDIIHYRNPLGPIGKLANTLFVKRTLNKIFEYRREKIRELFGEWREE